MPFVNVQITREDATREQKAEIIAESDGVSVPLTRCQRFPEFRARASATNSLNTGPQRRILMVPTTAPTSDDDYSP